MENLSFDSNIDSVDEQLNNKINNKINDEMNGLINNGNFDSSVNKILFEINNIETHNNSSSNINNPFNNYRINNSCQNIKDILHKINSSDKLINENKCNPINLKHIIHDILNKYHMILGRQNINIIIDMDDIIIYSSNFLINKIMDSIIKNYIDNYDNISIKLTYKYQYPYYRVDIYTPFKYNCDIKQITSIINYIGGKFEINDEFIYLYFPIHIKLINKINNNEIGNNKQDKIINESTY